MYQLAQEGKPMVYAYTMDTVNQFKLIQPPNVVRRSKFVPSPEIEKVLKDRSAWYLVDGPVDVGSLSFLPVNARVLQVTSPDREKFKDFLKAGADRYFMPVWTHHELEDCRGKLYPNLSADDLTELERIAGPIPRYVLQNPSMSQSFAKAREELKGITIAALARMSREDIALAIGAKDIADASVTYRVLHIEVDRIEFKSIRLGWASPFVEEQFFSRMMEVNAHALWLTYQNTLGSLKGIFYETWAHRILAKCGQTHVCMRNLKDKKTTKHLIGKRTLLLEQTYEQMTNMNDTTYGVPASRTFPVIDAVCLPYFFQMTIQSSHSIKLKPFAKFVYDMIKAGSMMQGQNINLVFVVPLHVIDEYTKCVPWSDD
jgi:hypothetical protein